MADGQGVILITLRTCIKLSRVLLTAVLLAAFLVLMAVISAPDYAEPLPTYTENELAEIEAMRDNALDPDSSLALQVDVDYSKGESAAWYPKGEPEILKELVAGGELPPVAERVGSEPCVVRGLDGIGQYGGSLLRLNHFGMGDRLTYANLVRFSPHGYPIVPHIAKGWEVSDDARTWTFYLRRGMKWSDGHPFTSEDIRFWFEDEASNKKVGGAIPGVMQVNGQSGKVIVYPDDPYKVTFEFAEPNGIFLAELAKQTGAPLCNSPAHYKKQFHPDYASEEDLETYMAQTRTPSVRALYTYISDVKNPLHPRLWPWVIRADTPSPPHTAVRNPYYFCVDEQGNQLPYADQVLNDECSADMVPIKAASGAVTAQGRNLGFSDYTYLMSQREEGNYDVYYWYAASRSYFVLRPNLNRITSPKHPEWRFKRELMNEKRFRQALSLAINRKAIIKAEYSGQAKPVNAAPGPESPFYHEELYTAFTDYDPERANEMLDALGLTQRDAEGYRTFRNGSRMTFYIDYVKGVVPSAPVHFVVRDWAAVGIRAIPRLRGETLFITESFGQMQDFQAWPSTGEHHPILSPGLAMPKAKGMGFATGFAKWLASGGPEGDPDAAGEPIPPEHPLNEALAAYHHACESPDLREQIRRFKPALDIAAEQVWVISVCSTPPTLVVVRNDVRNVPRKALYGWSYLTPGNCYPEAWYLTKDNNSPGAREDIVRNIKAPTPRARDPVPGRTVMATIETDGTESAPSKSSAIIGWVIKVLIMGSLGAFLVMVSIRHPFVLRRLVIMVPTLLIISVVVFTIIQLPPGDYLSSYMMKLEMLGDQASEQEFEEVREMFHLDESVGKRYARWLGLYWFTSFSEEDTGLLQGNLGLSMEKRTPVTLLIGDRLLLTFLISFGTILFTWAVALPIGIYSAVKQYSIGDYIFTFIGFIGMCIPAFLLALLLIYAADTWFGISIGGLFSTKFATQPEWDWPKIVDLLKHIWMPVVVLGLGGTAGMIRVMRANLLDELKKPYVVTARAKGVRPLKLLIKYPVRMALNPFISGIGHIFPQLVSGGAIVAIVLSLPTVGPLLLEALMAQDMYLAGSMLMILSMLGVFGTLVSDLLLLALDPRIRMEGK